MAFAAETGMGLEHVWGAECSNQIVYPKLEESGVLCRQSILFSRLFDEGGLKKPARFKYSNDPRKRLFFSTMLCSHPFDGGTEKKWCNCFKNSILCSYPFDGGGPNTASY